MKKSYILVTIAFDDDSNEFRNIDTELDVQKDITNLLVKYKNENKISHFVVADNDVISDKLKKW